MSTQQLQLVEDSSSLANYKAWAQAISDWFRTVGYTNTTDTGQLNGAGGGVGGAAGWAALGAAPGSAAFFYEIFQSNGSGLTTFYVKLEYGNIAGTNSPTIAITLGTGTNGSGTLTGFVTTRHRTASASFTPASATTPYECDFTGDGANDRIGVMMWRNAVINSQVGLIAIERSINASGVYTSGYVTVYVINGSETGTSASGTMETIVFGVGVAPTPFDRGFSAGATGWPVRSFSPTTGGTLAFNGSIPVDTIAPFVGFIDYPGTMVASMFGADFAEGVPFQITLYGSTRTYMVSKNGGFATSGVALGGLLATAMRYD